MNEYIVTGNDFVSLPCIRKQDGALFDFTFLYMGLKGAVDVRGTDDEPFLKPFFAANGKEIQDRGIRWSKTAHWVPTFTFETEEAVWSCTYLAPAEGRGFVVHLTCDNKTDAPLALEWGARGCWDHTHHATNADFRMQLPKQCWHSWHGLPVYGLVQGTALFAFSFFFDGADGERFNGENKFDYTLSDDVLRYRYTNTQVCPAGGRATYDLYFGLGYEAVAAITSGLWFSRRGYDALYADTRAFLDARAVHTGDGALDELLNYNLFFSYYFAAGVTLDTEELTLMTSRSPRYYVSAAYWDRDSLLWNFPAILSVDAPRAKRMLEYVYTKQIANVGVHSRFIDGTMLEPGFELDELCAPLLALISYADKTGDAAFLREPFVRKGVARILEILGTKRHPEVALYETMLYPSDDMHTYPYLTYDNVLAARALSGVARYAEELETDGAACARESAAVSEAVERYCVHDFGKGACYAWSTDLDGRHKLYDEPPGSLVLLPFYGHGTYESQTYRNTVAMLYDAEYGYSFAGHAFSEIGCAHCPHPWILSYCNSLLTGRKRENTLEKLKKLTLDCGIACETVHEDGGYSTSGDAFATCAGFLAYSLMTACAKKTDASAAF